MRPNLKKDQRAALIIFVRKDKRALLDNLCLAEDEHKPKLAFYYQVLLDALDALEAQEENLEQHP